MPQSPAQKAKSEPSVAGEARSLDSDVDLADSADASGIPRKSDPTLEIEGRDGSGTGEVDVTEVSEEEEDGEPDELDVSVGEGSQTGGSAEAPPLPEEELPPLPQEPLPVEDDGWAPVWDPTSQAFYFYNRFTGATQWTNPRVPEASQFVEPNPAASSAPSTASEKQLDLIPVARPAGGYDPSIHGDYDPSAWYAQPPPSAEVVDAATQLANPTDAYAATGAFNRFTGRWQAADVGPELHNDENKSKRQMNAFFDVDAAANSHDGRSLKAERSGKKLSKTELKQFKEKRKAKKEEKRRAWLRD